MQRRSHRSTIVHVGGTRGYMAPELSTGSPCTPASDMFSLGVVCREVRDQMDKVQHARGLKEMDDLISKLTVAQPVGRLNAMQAGQHPFCLLSQGASSMPDYWHGRHGCNLVKCEGPVYAPLRDSLQKCLHIAHPEWLGAGVDVHDPFPTTGWNKLKLARAWRIENFDLWQSYQSARQKLQSAVDQNTMSIPQVVSNSVLATGSDELPGELIGSVNERYLLHCCAPGVLPSIMHHGFNERYAGSNAGSMFGQGNYFAEEAGKSDQYASRDQGCTYSGEYRSGRVRYNCSDLQPLHQLLYANPVDHPEDVFYVLVCRVVLGHQIATADGTNQLGQQPLRTVFASTSNRRELANIDGLHPTAPHHSLFVEACPDGPSVNGCPHNPKHRVCRYNEHVSFHSHFALPEYLIAYQRVMDKAGGPPRKKVRS